MRLLYRLTVTVLQLLALVYLARAFNVHGALGYLLIGIVIGTWTLAFESVVGVGDWSLDKWKRGLR